MKKPLLIMFLFLLPLTYSFAQTQMEMNQSAGADYQKADKELNVVYKRLMQKLDEPKKQLLVESEKEWIKFRDLHCKLACKDNEGGTIYPLVYNSCLTDLTAARTKQLQDLLKAMDN